MCGRFAFYSAAEAVSDLFGVDDAGLSVRPQYNIAPTDRAAVIRPEADGHALAMLRWGLVPFWAKDLSIGNRMINARSETVAEKPAFRAAFKQRRCVVPANGYYEWTGSKGNKQPHYITRGDGIPIGFAGLWERWHDKANDDSVETFTILTQPSSGPIAHLHHRMPVMLDDVTAEYWLEGDGDNPPALRELKVDDYAEALTSWRVTKAVNNARNESPDLVERLSDDDAEG
ncbi:MAG: SOS response-associated peptidase [Pseudomonadota bacterium]